MVVLETNRDSETGWGFRLVRATSVPPSSNKVCDDPVFGVETYRSDTFGVKVCQAREKTLVLPFFP
jgi:hypothetical protein